MKKRKLRRHPSDRVRDKYNFWGPECTVPIHKARKKGFWHAVKDPKWFNQDYDNWNDLEDGHYWLRSCDKGWQRLERMIKHKLYFHIPITDADKEAIISRYPEKVRDKIDVDAVLARLIASQQKNVDRIIEREKRKQAKKV